MENMETRYCQSCGMPMDGPDSKYGTEKDGKQSGDYCSYCYQDGEFTTKGSMEDMVEQCVPFVKEHFGSDEAARKAMAEFFPMLKRWKA